MRIFRFNLVIEKLLIPTRNLRHSKTSLHINLLFQSRNRETFDSNPRSVKILAPVWTSFQSRNRETFDSNYRWQWSRGTLRFRFQSRNRETFDSNPLRATSFRQASKV